MSCSIYFDDARLVVATGKAFRGFGGLESIEQLPLDADDHRLMIAVRAAWTGSTSTMEYTDHLIWESMAPVREFFGVDNVAMTREIHVISHEDHFRFIPTEWKADNRSFLKNERVILPPDASDTELAAGIRRAMELTTS